MGWGDPPHEGYTARRLNVQAAAHNDYPDQGDRRWTAAFSNATRGTEGWESRCSCGWRSERFHPNDDPQRDFEPEEVGDRVWAEWRDTHMAPLVDPEANRVLVLATDAGGWRHLLDGQAVHAGSQLELRLADDVWVPVRYEWGWDARPPRVYLSLGGRGERIGPEWAPDPVSFALPAGAELRWPADDRPGERGSGEGRRLLRGCARRADSCARRPANWCPTRSSLGGVEPLMVVFTGDLCIAPPAVVSFGHGATASALREDGVSTYQACRSQASGRPPSSPRA